MKTLRLVFASTCLFFGVKAFAGPGFHIFCKDDHKSLSIYDLKSQNGKLIEVEFSTDVDDPNVTYRADLSANKDKPVNFESVFTDKLVLVGRFFNDDHTPVKIKAKGEDAPKYTGLKSIYLQRKEAVSEPDKLDFSKVVLHFAEKSSVKLISFSNCKVNGNIIGDFWPK